MEFEPKKKEKLTFLKHRGEEFVFLFRGRWPFIMTRRRLSWSLGTASILNRRFLMDSGPCGVGRRRPIVVVFPEE